MRRLNLDQLRAVVDVVRLGSFSAAARELHLTQPAISLQVRELESRLGVQLVERLGKRAYATAAGSELIQRARVIDRAVEDAEDAMRRHREGWLGRARIGTGAAILSYLLPPVLRALRRAHSGLELVIVSAGTERIVEMLMNNELDIGLVTLPVSERMLEVVKVREDPLVAVLPRGRRAFGGPIGAAELSRHPLIFEIERTRMHELARDWFRAAGIEPKSAMELGGFVAIRNVVSAGLGASILPVEAVMGRPADAPVTIRPLRPALSRSLAVVQRRDKPPDRALAIVREALLGLRAERIAVRGGARRGAPR